MKTIAIANQKGGCGKTTTAVNLSSALSYKGRKVLLVDLDPQSHAGLSFGIDVEGLEFSVYDVLKDPSGHGMGMDDILIMVRENLFLAPSTVLLCAIEQELSGLPGREFRFSEQLTALQQTFDYAIIDCPPSIGLLTFNALTASHEVIIPIEASIYSIHGVGRLLDEIKLVEKNRDRPLPYTVVETMYDHRMKYSRRVYKELQEKFGENFFPIPIHHTVKVREAAKKGVPLHEFAPDCTAFVDYLEMADSVIQQEGALAAEALNVVESNLLAPMLLEEGMRFAIYAPHARSVQIAGDFNVWNPEEGLMSADDRGVWSLTLPLTSGKYNYKFVVDGDWVTDPNNPSSEKDAKGNLNSIVNI